MTSFKRSGLAGLLGICVSASAVVAGGALGACGAAQPPPPLPPNARGGGPPALIDAPVVAPSASASAADGAQGAHSRDLAALERDVAAAELRWDWPAAFARLDDAKGVDPDEVAIRRTRAAIAWEAFVDETLARIVAKRSAKEALGERREAFMASIDPARMPSDVAVSIYSRERRIRGVLLVFDRLAEGTLLETPTTYWAYGAAPTRNAATPEVPGKPFPRNASFLVFARGKLDGVALLAVGTASSSAAAPSPPTDPLERLESITALVLESSTRPYDTAAFLPPDLQPGDRVLASFAPWPTQLVLHEVLTVKDDALSIRPLVGGTARPARRNELRADFLPTGVAVLVPVASTFKRGQFEARLDDEQAVVTLEGARQTVPVASLRFEARTMPAAPHE
jgi:hypothetical protein